MWTVYGMIKAKTIYSTRKLTLSEKVQYDLDLWPIHPKIYKCFLFIFYLYIKYEIRPSWTF